MSDNQCRCRNAKASRPAVDTLGGTLSGFTQAVGSGFVRHRAGRARSRFAPPVCRGVGEARFSRLRAGWIQHGRIAGADAGGVAGLRGAPPSGEAALSDGRRPAGRHPGRGRGRARPVRLRAANAEWPQCHGIGFETLGTGEILPRSSPVARVTPAGTSAGGTSTICFRWTKCSGQRCSRSTISPSTYA